MARSHTTGVPELRRALKKAQGLAPAALTGAMVVEQEKVMAKAKERTPVDTGTLRASGTVLPPRLGGTSIEVVAGFGGAASDYAIYVHEDLTKRHPVGTAKFLESAFLERQPRIPRELAKVVEQVLKRVG